MSLSKCSVLGRPIQDSYTDNIQTANINAIKGSFCNLNANNINSKFINVERLSADVIDVNQLINNNPDPISSIPPLLNTVFVAKNGVDNTATGAIDNPFLTVQAAMEYAWNNIIFPVGAQPSSPFTRPCIFISAGTYDDGPMILIPQIVLMGEGYNNTRLIGDWTIDYRWSNSTFSIPPSPFPENNIPGIPTANVDNDCRSGWINLGLFGGTITVDFGTFSAGEGKLFAINVRFAVDMNITQKSINPSSNELRIFGGELLADVTFNGIPTNLLNVFSSGTINFNQISGTGVDNLLNTHGGSLGNIVLTALIPAAPILSCTFQHNAQNNSSLTLNGAFSTISACRSSIPLQSLVMLIGGSTLNQIIYHNSLLFSGITANRPTMLLHVGQMFFDTTLGIPIWYNGAFWVNAIGIIV